MWRLGWLGWLAASEKRLEMGKLEVALALERAKVVWFDRGEGFG